MIKHSIPIIFVAAILLASCATTDPAPPKAPPWLQEYPASEDYFVGIGTVPADSQGYREQAYQLALSELASQISVTIEADFQAVTSGSQDGTTTKFVQELRRLVAAELEGVELVDEYSTDTEYSVYLRLDKSQWRLQKNRREQELSSSLTSLMDSLERPNQSLAQRFAVLGQMLELVDSSPISRSFLMKYRGLEASPADIVRRSVSNQLDRISITIDAEDSAVSGVDAGLDVAISPAAGIESGRISLDLLFDGRVIDGFATDSEGNYSGEFSTEGLPVGLQRLQIAPAGLGSRNPASTWLFDLRITKIPLVYSGDDEHPSFNGRFQDILGTMTDRFDLIEAGSNGSVGEYRLMVDIEIFDYPKTEASNIFFVDSLVNISIQRGEVELASYSSDKIKEGGLSREQAVERSVTRQLDALAGDMRLRRLLDTISP